MATGAEDTKEATSPQWTVKPDGEINIKVNLEIVTTQRSSSLYCSLFIKDTIGPTLPVLNTCTV